MPKAPFTLRPARAAEWKRLHELDPAVPAAALRKKIADGEVVVAWVDHFPAGYLRLELLWSRMPFIGRIYVAEKHRFLGIGRALLAHAEKRALASNAGFLISSAEADHAPGQAWHRAMGFIECGFLAGLNPHGVGEVFFRKRLGRDRRQAQLGARLKSPNT